MIFGIVIGNYKFNASLSMVNMAVTLVLLLFFVSRLAGNSGLKKANILWTSVSIATYAAMWIFLLAVDTLQITVNPILKVLFIVLYCAMGASKMATSCVSNPLRFDIIDYEFSRSGRYMPAVVNTTYSFVDKLISSLASTIVAVAVASIGYTEGMPQATDPLTSGVFWVGTFLWLGMPILGYICTLVAMRWYKLDKETMEQVQRKNAETRAALKARKLHNNDLRSPLRPALMPLPARMIGQPVFRLPNHPYRGFPARCPIWQLQPQRNKETAGKAGKKSGYRPS